MLAPISMFHPELQQSTFLDAAGLMAEWADSNTMEDQVWNEQVYKGHCCLRAIASVNKGPNYLIHLHRAFFSLLFCPPRLPRPKPYWENSYEARILALCFAAEICKE